MDDRHVSRTVLRGYAQLHVPENCGGSYPMKDIQHRIHTANSSDVYGQQVLPYKKFRQKEKTMIGALVMVCTPVADLHVPSWGGQHYRTVPNFQKNNFFNFV